MESDGYERLRRARGFTLGLLGSFIFAFSSVVITVKQQPIYLALGLLSISSLVLAHYALKSQHGFYRLVFVIGAGAVLSAEASMVMLYFLTFNAVVYTFATLGGALFALKGITDMETPKVESQYWERRKEAIPKELTA